MKPPSLVAPQRRAVVAVLLVVALIQGVAAAGSAEAIRIAIGARADAMLMPALVIAAMAMTAGVAVLGERWVGERLAQSYVIDTRRCLFDAVIAQGSSGREARWLTPLVSDLAALRNWAARGPVRLVTASLAGSAATIWFLIAWPRHGVALVPMGIGLVLIMLGTRQLTHVIAEQRRERGALTSFLIRRVRAEVSARISPRGHGRNGLALRSARLGLKAERRAFVVGIMEATAVTAGALSALALVVAAVDSSSVDKGALIAGLALIAFIATRLLEIARALHAHVGGKVAQRRIARLLGDPVTDGALVR